TRAQTLRPDAVGHLGTTLEAPDPVAQRGRGWSQRPFGESQCGAQRRTARIPRPSLGVVRGVRERKHTTSYYSRVVLFSQGVETIRALTPKTRTSGRTGRDTDRRRTQRHTGRAQATCAPPTGPLR